MRLVLEGDTVKFEPDFKDFEVMTCITFSACFFLGGGENFTSFHRSYSRSLVYFFQVVLLNVYDVMIKAVMVVPRVETKLYSEWVSL